jgi:hypothetical protein
MCVAASGNHVIPSVIASRDSENLQQGLRTKEVESASHLTVKKSQKADVNGKPFAEDVKSTFVPYVMKVHADGSMQAQEAVISMDNCLSHITGDIIDLFTAAGATL